MRRSLSFASFCSLGCLTAVAVTALAGCGRIDDDSRSPAGASDQPGSPSTGASGIAVDTDSIYWTAFQDGASGGVVMRAPKAGGAVQTLASNQAGPDPIVVDDTNVYWVNAQETGGDSPLSLQRVAKSGGTPETLASGSMFDAATSAGAINQTWSLAQEGGTLYWVSSHDASVLSVDAASGAVQTLASGLGSPLAIALDATNVYWASGGQGAPDGAARTLSRVALAGGSVTTFPETDTTTGEGTAAMVALARGASGVYFSTGFGDPGDVCEMLVCDE